MSGGTPTAAPAFARFVIDRSPDVVMPPWVAVHHAPTSPGLYSCWSPAMLDRPVYIGASVSLRARLRAWFGTDGHRAPWPEQIRWVAMDLAESIDLAEMEAAEIQLWGPLRNTRGIELPYASGPWT